MRGAAARRREKKRTRRGPRRVPGLSAALVRRRVLPGGAGAALRGERGVRPAVLHRFFSPRRAAAPRIVRGDHAAVDAARAAPERAAALRRAGLQPRDASADSPRQAPVRPPARRPGRRGGPLRRPAVDVRVMMARCGPRAPRLRPASPRCSAGREKGFLVQSRPPRSGQTDRRPRRRSAYDPVQSRFDTCAQRRAGARARRGARALAPAR